MSALTGDFQELTPYKDKIFSSLANLSFDYVDLES